MPSVTVNGRDVEIERFTLAKASRVITLLQKLQKKVPEVSKAWAEYSRDYGNDYAVTMTRMQALARFGPALEHISDAEWEREGQTFTVPGSPSAPEIFFELAPLVYEHAEELALRLLGIIALDNETVQRYVASGDIWERVDEFVDEVIRPAPLDELVELVVVTAEVIDGTILAKVRSLGDRAGNVARLFGMKSKTETSSGQPVQPNTVTASDSPNGLDGSPGSVSDSRTTLSSTSSDSLTPSTITTAA